MSSTSTQQNARVARYGYAAIAILALGLVELATYTVSKAYLLQRIPFLLYIPPDIDTEDWRHYMRERDPVLGWPSKGALASADHDASGSRRIPAYPTPGDECVTLYGDSYTYGSEVSDSEAWSNILSQRLKCRVGNFGVGGYGTDQSLLRFTANDADKAPVTILGLFPANMMRNVNQYRHLRTGDSPLGFKPRFVVEEDTLLLIPKPDPTRDELESLEDDLSRLLPHEAFQPGTAVGPVPFEFPFTLTVGRLLLHDQVWSWLLDKPSWIDFLDSDHPSRALQLTVGICLQFLEECQRRNKECFVLLLPTPSSYQYYKSTGRLAMQLVMDEFSRLGIPHYNLTPLFAEQLGPRPFSEILTNQPQPGMGHFDAEGNSMVASFIVGHLVEIGARMDD